MKYFRLYCLLILTGVGITTKIEAQIPAPHVCELCHAEIVVPDSLIVSDPVALFESLPQPEINNKILNWSLVPKVFSGYQEIIGIPKYSERPLRYHLATQTPLVEDIVVIDSIALAPDYESATSIVEEVVSNPVPVIEDNGLPPILTYKTPDWLRNAVKTSQFQENLLYSYMIDHPLSIEYAYWDLPLPPVLLEEDRSFMGFLRKQVVPEIDPSEAILPEVELKKKHWLHTVSSQLQFSQAYVSPNWYQGGNNYLSMLFGFNWKVNLNQVYHPKVLFQSDLQYKVAFSSNPKGYLHKYTIAEDNFQYNLNLGLKAAKEWYYSYNLQFKTQLFNNFEENSYQRTAAFLSPADLNMGLGMSYNHKNKLGTFQFTLTVSPLSYNLKICMKNNDIIDHATYGIAADKHTKSEIGSNLDYTMDWKMTANISYKTRMFMFTDYHYFLADWQNTFNFDINKFLSTQLFVHLRYDGSTENYGNWKKFMLREILSFGLTYTFSTKP